MKCLLSDAMIAHTAAQPSTAVSSPSNSSSSPASPNTSNTSPLSQANANLLANSPSGAGDGAVNKRSIAEAQGAGDTRTVFQGVYQALKSQCGCKPFSRIVELRSLEGALGDAQSGILNLSHFYRRFKELLFLKHRLGQQL